MFVSKKRLLSLLVTVVFVAAGCLGGCASPAAVVGSPAVSNEPAGSAQPAGTGQTAAANADPAWDDKPIELKFWYTYGADSAERKQLLDVVLPSWSKMHPNVKIKAVPQESGESYHQATVAAIATGATPDIARIDIIYTAAYAKRGALAALDAFPDFEAIKGTFLEAPLATNFYKGKYYGLPLDTNCKAAVINTNVMKAMGIADGIPETMEEFITAAEPYVKPTGKSVLHVSGVGDWDLYPYFWLFGGVLTNEDFTKASGFLDSAQSVGAMGKMLDLYQKKVFSIGEIDGTVDAWGKMESGLYGMYFEGPWYFGAYDENKSPVVVPALIPTYNGKTASVVGGQDIVVFAKSKYPEASYEFAKFMCTEDLQNAMLEAGVFPTLKAVSESEKIKSDPVLSIYMEQIKSAGVRIPSPEHAAIFEIWKNAVNKIFLKGADIQTELTNAAKLIDAKLAS